MPDYIRITLQAAGVMDDFARRPPYQRNDYLGWIGRDKRADTRRRRLEQMLDELRRGGAYMRMPHPPSRKPG